MGSYRLRTEGACTQRLVATVRAMHAHIDADPQAQGLKSNLQCDWAPFNREQRRKRRRCHDYALGGCDAGARGRCRQLAALPVGRDGIGGDREERGWRGYGCRWPPGGLPERGERGAAQRQQLLAQCHRVVTHRQRVATPLYAASRAQAGRCYRRIRQGCRLELSCARRCYRL